MKRLVRKSDVGENTGAGSGNHAEQSRAGAAQYDRGYSLNPAPPSSANQSEVPANMMPAGCRQESDSTPVTPDKADVLS